MTNYTIKESFRWLTPESFKVESIGKNTVKVRGVALRADAISKNNRKYVKEELVKAARTWINKPVTINHDANRIAGHIDWMEFEDPLLEYLMTIKKQPYVDMFRNHDKKIKGVSVEADYLYNRCAKCGERFYDEEAWQNHMVEKHLLKDLPTEPHGIKGTFLSVVVDPEVPGVPGTTTELWETLRKSTPLKLLETVTKIKKEQLEWKTKMDKATVAVSTPESISIGKARESKVKEQEEDIKPGSHYCEEHPDDPRCKEHKKAIHGEEKKTKEQEQTGQTLPEPTVEAPVECAMGFEPDGQGGCKPKEWHEETPPSPAPLMVPEPTIEPAKVVDTSTVAPAASLVIEQEADHGALPPAPFPETPAEPPTVIDQPCPVGSHWDKIAGTCVKDPMPEQPAGLEGRTDFPASMVSEIRLPKMLKLGEPFANYDNFEDCVAKNPDKEDPEAYCADIKRKTEGETVKETMFNIYEQVKHVDNRGLARDSKLAETMNILNTGVASLTKTVAHIPRSFDKQLMLTDTLRVRDFTNLRHGINKYAKSLNETAVRTNRNLQSTNTYLKQLAETANKNTRRIDTLLSNLATDNAKLRAELRETKTSLVNKVEANKKDYEKVTHLIEQVKGDEIKSLTEQKKALEQELEQRKCGPDEHYSEEEGKCVPNKPKEPEKTEETKKIEEMATKIDNLEAKLKGEFKGKNQPIKETEKTSYTDPSDAYKKPKKK